MEDFLLKLVEKDIYIELVKNELSVRFPKSGVDQVILEEIKFRKQAIVDYLSNLNEEKFVIIPALPYSDHYPISDGQRRLWVLSQFEEGSVAYNMPGHAYFNEDINIEYFKRAIDSTIERHEILRTVLKADGQGEIRQWILKKEDLDFKIDYKDFRKTENKKELVQSYIEEGSYKAFDLEKGPLFKADLLQIEDSAYVFSFNMHHIISDGWSMDVLTKDIFSFYEAYKENKSPELKDLRIQYKDYSSWQLAQLETESFKAHRNYWLKNLEGELPLLDLPSTKQRPRIKTNKGYGLGTYIDGTTSAKLKKYSQENGGSLFMGLLAVWNILMYRYTSQKDIITGTPIAGRDHADLEDQIGFYVNTLALRNEINPEESFNLFYKRLKDNILKSYNHQMYPFDRLVEELNLQRDTSRSVIFDVMLVLQNSGEKRDGLELKKEELNRITDQGYRTSKFDLDIAFQELGDYLSMQVEFNPDVYEKEMIECLINHYRQLLDALLESPEEKISEIDYMSEEEKHELLVTFNDREVAYPKDKTIVDLFEEQVAKTPNNIAVIFEGTEFTYKQLDEYSNQLTRYLQNNYEIKHDDLVGIKQDKSEWMIISILGVLKSGGAYVPIDPEYPQERIEYIEKDTKCKVCIDEKELKKFKTKQQSYSKEKIISDTKPDDLAYVIYTSGSTGRPKGVMVSHSNLINKLFEEKTVLYINDEIVTYCLTNYVFDVSLLEILLPLILGGKIIVPTRDSINDPLTTIKQLINYKVNLLQGTPTYFTHFIAELTVESAKELNQILRTICIGGESLNAKLVDKIKNKLPDILLNNHYGPTEITIDAIVNLNLNSFESNVLGKPLGNTKIYVLDDYQKLVPLNVVGEIVISGPSVAQGYLRQNELNGEKFIINSFKEGERFYKTGDLGRWLSDGTIEFIGRKDNQIKIRGYRVELGEIESAISKNKLIEEVVVICRQFSEDQKHLIAYIKRKEQFFKNSKTQATFKVKVFDGSQLMQFDMESIHSISWPKFFEGDEIMNKYWKQLYSKFPEYQIGVYSNEKLLVAGNSIPIYWNGNNEEIPEGWDHVLKAGFDNLNNRGKCNTLCVLAAVVDSEASGKGLSYEILKVFVDLAKSLGYEHLIVPVRPTSKTDFPDMSIEKYWEKRTEAGEIYDNWIRVHSNLGGKVLKYSDKSQEVVGSVADWEKWTGHKFKKSGEYEIEGAMQKVKINLENETGHYFDQCIWYEHRLDKKSENNIQFFSISELRKELADQVPLYMIPEYFIELDKFPQTFNGKIDKKVLVDPKELINGVEYLAPRNEMEQKLVRIWEDVLQRENIGVKDDFFALGGHSLKLIRLRNEYKLILDKEVSLNFFMTNPTIQEHAEYLTNSFNRSIENTEELIKLNTFKKDNKNMIMIPPIQGESIYFMGFSNFIETEYNCYGINYGTDHGYKSLDELAEYYSDLINKKFFNMDVVLDIVGFSMGGHIAFEIVKKLEKFGHTCKLYLIDCIPNTQKFLKSIAKINSVHREMEIDHHASIASKIFPNEDSTLIRKRIINNLEMLNNYQISAKIKSPISCLEQSGRKLSVNMKLWKNFTHGHFMLEKIESTHDEIFNKENYERLSNFIKAKIKKSMFDWLSL